MLSGLPSAGGTTRTLSDVLTIRCLDGYNDFFKGVDHNGSASVYSSTTTGAVSVDDTTVAVASVANLSVGELIFIDPDSDEFETRVVDSIDGTTITVTEAFDYDHDSGVVCGQVWSNDSHIFNGGKTFGRFIANAITADPGTVVVLGDSWDSPANGEYLGFKASIEARFPSATVVNAWTSGNRLDQMVARWETDVAPSSPDTVVIMSGFANDVYQNRTADQLKATITDLVGLCVDEGCDLYMAGVAPFNVYPSRASSLAPVVEGYVNSYDRRPCNITVPSLPEPSGTLAETIAGLSPAGYWKLDEESGTDAIDTATAGNDGTYSGTYTLADTAGPDANYVTFGGGRVTVPDADNLSPGASGFTVVALIKRSGSTEDVIAAKTSGTTAAEYQFFTNSAGKLQMTILGNGSTNTVLQLEQSNSSPLADTDWHVVAFTTPNRTAGTRGKLFVDSGTSLASSQLVATSGTFTATTSDLTIGIRELSSASPFAGSIAHLAIWQSGLSDANIASIVSAATADGWIS